jgi:phage recombination protein Bet
MSDEKTGSAIVRVAESAAIELTADTVHRYVNQHANPQEIALFLNQCVMFGLNPFKREIYLIKYKPNEPATFVVGYESYLKRADRTGLWMGMESGTTDGPDGQPITAWVKVYRRGWDKPLFHEVYFNEYCQYKDEVVWENGQSRKTGKKVRTRFWAEKPRTMLKKVAIAQAIRMAFPDEMGGMPYIAEERIDEPDKLATAEIVPDAEYERMKAKPLGRPRDEFDPPDETPGNAPKTAPPATPAPSAAPAADRPATAKPAPNPANPPARRGPGRPPSTAKAKPAPAAADPTNDPDDPNWRAPFDDEPPPAETPAPVGPIADPDKLADLKTAIAKLREMGISDEKIYIGINRNLVANKQMVIADLNDLDNIGIGVAIAYINSWRHKLIDDRAKADKEKAGR